MIAKTPKCQECGLPVLMCNMRAVARQAAEQYLCENGIGAVTAREQAAKLDFKEKE
jgi:hypothetical protein